MSGLSADNLVKQYSGHQVVENFQLQLNTGEIVGLLGPNGAGKTTTLQMLAGHLQPDSGCINIDDQPLSGNRKLQSRIGYLPERPPLYDALTVSEQLQFAAELFSLENPLLLQRIDTVLELCELTNVKQKLIGQLSKGFRQRLGIAQSLLHDPQIILLDEPTDGLDPKQIHALRKLIRELGKKHGVLLSSHLLNEVEQVCDRVIIMHEGRSIFSESLQSLQQSDKSLESIFMQLIYQDAGTAE